MSAKVKSHANDLGRVSLRKTVEKMRKYFNFIEEIRDRVVEYSRKVVRASSRSISALHRGDMKTSSKFLAEADRKLRETQRLARRTPEMLYSGTVESAQQEYCEARLMHGFLKNGRIMGPEEIGVPYRPYLGGLADMVGELRRHSLDLMRDGKVAEAGKVLETMEKISENLMEFDYPDAIIHGMRKKQDMVRGIIEKTRGELTIAMRQHSLERELRRARENET